MKSFYAKYLKYLLNYRLLTNRTIADYSGETLPVIVSLTSIASRLDKVDLVILSLLVAPIPPEKIFLWLHSSLRSSLPRRLTRLQGNRFEIRFTQEDNPHCKLIPARTAYPEAAIVTVDDDHIYSPNLIAALYANHLMYPARIITMRGREIGYENGAPIAYVNWKSTSKPGTSTPELMQMGFCGVLYPPNALHSDFANQHLIAKLSPKADDLWFKAMAHLNGTQVMTCTKPVFRLLELPTDAKQTLAHFNVRQDGNTTQWRAICKHYNIRFSDSRAA